MDKKLLNGFEEEEEEKGKIRRNISIDWDLDYELNKRKETLNVSKLINQFLWYYIKKLERDEKQERDDNKTDRGGK